MELIQKLRFLRSIRAIFSRSFFPLFFYEKICYEEKNVESKKMYICVIYNIFLKTNKSVEFRQILFFSFFLNEKNENLTVQFN